MAHKFPLQRRFRTRSVASLLAACALVALVGCDRGQRSPGGAVPSARSATSSWGSFYVTYQPSPDPIPLNEVFSLSIAVAPAANHVQPAVNASIAVDARMPEHNHGMNLTPAVTMIEPGKFRVDGLLFHMPGRWELYVDVTQDAETERAIFAIHLD